LDGTGRAKQQIFENDSVPLNRTFSQRTESIVGVWPEPIVFQAFWYFKLFFGCCILFGSWVDLWMPLGLGPNLVCSFSLPSAFTCSSPAYSKIKTPNCLNSILQLSKFHLKFSEISVRTSSFSNPDSLI
jgi:hypothetical protein